MLRIARHQPCVMAGTGTALAESSYSNREVVARFAGEGRRGPRSAAELDELAALMGEQLGVERRTWTHVPGEPFARDATTTVDLQRRALERALESASMSAGELGAIVAATSTPARATGANAPAVAQQLGARCATFDVRAGCSGGLWALSQACLLAAQSGQPVAAVAGDTFSVLAPPSVALAVLALGDGAAAVIVTPGDDHRGLCGAAFASDGALAHLGGAPAPFPPTAEAIANDEYFMRGDPAQLAAIAPARYREIAHAALACAGLGVSDVDLFVPHQTGRHAIEAAAGAIGIPMDQVVITVGEHANCGAGAALIALDAAARDGRLAGATVLMAALGGGLSWGSLVLRC